MNPLLNECPAPSTCAVCRHALHAIDLYRAGEPLPVASKALIVAQRVHPPSCESGPAVIELAAGLIAFSGHDPATGTATLERALAFARRDVLPALRAEIEAAVAIGLWGWQPAPDTAAKLRECALNVVQRSRHASPAAQYRIALSMAIHYLQVGADQRSARWFERARRFAALTDDARVSASLRRQIVLQRAWGLRRRQVIGSPVDAAVMANVQFDMQQIIDAESAGTANRRYTQLLLYRAFLLMIEQSFDRALSLFEQCLPVAISGGMPDETLVGLADRALCRLHAGETARARADLDAALQRVDQTGDAYAAAAVYLDAAAYHRLSGDQNLARLAERTATDWVRVGGDVARAVRLALRRGRSHDASAPHAEHGDAPSLR